MFTVNDDLSIYATRGDTVFFNVTAHDHGYPYKFQPGDIVRMAIYGRKDATNCVMQKDFPVEEVSETVFIYLEEEDTKIGESISKHKDYWYEVVLNPDTIPQTIIGYDEDGAKIFRLFPESEEIHDEPAVEPEDIPVVDSELDMTSHRPIENQAVARAVAMLLDVAERTDAAVSKLHVTPDMFGAIGDGKADDTESLLACVESLPTGGTLVLPANKSYMVSDTIAIEKNVNVFALGTIVFNGERNKPIVSVANCVRKYLYFNNIRDVATAEFHGWEDDNYCGLELINLKNTICVIGGITNTTTGLRIKSVGGLNGGTVNNEFNIRTLTNCKTAIDFYGDGKQSWINANVFNNAWINFASDGAANNVLNANVARFGIKETFVNGCEFPHDANIFNNLKIDVDRMSGSFVGVHASRARSWVFNDYRIEITNSPSATFCELDCQYNEVRDFVFRPCCEFRSVDYNFAINVLNYGAGKTPLSSVYTKERGTNQTKNLLLEKFCFNGMFKRYAGSYNFIKGWRTLSLSNRDLFGNANKESALIYTSYYDNKTPRVSECVRYLYQPIINTTFTIMQEGNSGNAVTLRCYDASGKLLTHKTLSTNSFYLEDGIYKQNVVVNKVTFTVCDESVSYVAIGLIGNMSTISIFGDQECTILTGVGSMKPGYDYAVVTPTLTDDFEYGDVLLGTSSHGWKLDVVDGAKQWVAI